MSCSVREPDWVTFASDLQIDLAFASLRNTFVSYTPNSYASSDAQNLLLSTSIGLPTVMSQSASPDALPWLPAPRVSSLVYRSKPHASESSSDPRPRPSAQDEVVASHFATLNAVEGGDCWMTGIGDAERVHVVPHAEGECTRLVS